MPTGWLTLLVSTRAAVLVDPATTVTLRRQVLRPHETDAEVAAAMTHPRLLAVGVPDGDRLLACALAQPEPCPDPVGGGSPWRLRGMATDPDHRGRGLGASVLARLLDEVAARGADVVWCNARTPAVGLYARAGFVVVGEPWEDPVVGPHVRMAVSLPRPG
jgi:GNAT superfamily N-acetyltransferase